MNHYNKHSNFVSPITGGINSPFGPNAGPMSGHQQIVAYQIEQAKIAKEKKEQQDRINAKKSQVEKEKKAYAEKKEQEQKELENAQMNMPMDFTQKGSKGVDTKKLAVFVGIPIVLVVVMALVIKKKK